MAPVGWGTAPWLDGLKGDNTAPVGWGTSLLVEAVRMMRAAASLLQPDKAAADAGLVLLLPGW